MIDEMKIMNSGAWQCPDYVPFSMLCGAQAYTNHGQSLSGLNKRGGVTASECLALIMQVGCLELMNISEEFASAVITREILSQHKVDLLKTENKALNDRIEGLQVENINLGDRKANIKDAYNGLHKENQIMYEKNERLNMLIDELKAENEALKVDLGVLKLSLTETLDAASAIAKDEDLDWHHEALENADKILKSK